MGNKRDLKSKLKFIFVTADKFPPFRPDVSVLFGEEIAGRGHSIDWVLQSNTQCRKSYRTIWSGCRVWVGATDPGKSRFCRLRKHIYGILHDLKMFSLLRKQNYDFIQVKDKFLSAVLAIVASKLNRVTFFYWLSFPFPEADLYAVNNKTARYPLCYLVRGTILKFLLYRVILPQADHIFVQSEQMKKDLEVNGVSDLKMTPVPMGISREVLCTDPLKQLSASKNEKAVLYLGTLIKERRIDFIIRVFSRVMRQFPSAKLYLVGGGSDPSDEQILKDEAVRLGIDHAVVFTGFLPREQAWHYVTKADVCVSPFYPIPILNSTSPTKLIEYMAMGKPVVASDHPEQRLVVLESGAGLCVPYQEDAFADAIINLLNNPKKIRYMGEKGRRYVEKYRTYKTIADMVEREYLRICRRSGDEFKLRVFKESFNG